MPKLLLFVLLISFMSQASDQKFLEFSVATTELPPYVSLNENKKAEGLFVEMLNKVQASTAIKIRLFVMPWGRAISEVKKGNIDAILPTLWSEERSQYLVYPTLPFYTFNQSVLIKRIDDDFEFTDLSNIGSQIVIGKTRSVMVDKEFALLVNQGKLSIYETNKLDQALLMLAQKKVDLVASDGEISSATIKQLGLSKQFVLIPMHGKAPPSYIAFSRQFAEIHDVNKLMSLIAEEL